jgi:A/G-specific adenine glycosylase
MQSTDAFVQAIMRGHKNNYRPLPWRKDVTPYRTLVAEVMLQRTTARLAADHFEKVVEAYPDLQSLARADDAELNAMLQPICMPKRAATLKQAACQIRETRSTSTARSGTAVSL